MPLVAGAALLPILVAGAAAQDEGEPVPESPNIIVLDTITVVPTKTEEELARSLAAVSHVGGEELQRLQPTQASEIFFGMPGVAAQSDSRRSQTSINIRGLQDFGRVGVIVDGARNNFQRSDHGTQSVFWIEPEMLKDVTVVRGPVSNIYGSGAIGGVVVFETIDAFDFLRYDEKAAASLTTRFETNGPSITTSATAAARIADTFGMIGNLTYKDLGDFTDGNGDLQPGTGAEVLAGMLKATLRPDENQELEAGWIAQHHEWTERFGTGRDTELDQHTFTGKYEYSDPDNDWLDLHISGYVNDAEQMQVQLGDEIQYDSVTGLPTLIPAGSERAFNLRTVGIDAWNTSRLETFGLHHAITYGGDWFHDDVDTVDPAGGGDVYTPSGERVAYGAFAQDKIDYSDWLQIIGGLRFDGYRLEGEEMTGAPVESDGTHLSPRLTVGVSPLEHTPFNGLQVYGTYAQGYRSPAVTETLISGLHPAGVVFPFLPNPNLGPETATTYEIGLNFARDNLFIDGDGLRAKAAVFRNDVEDYIGLEEIAAGSRPDCPFLALPPVWVPGGYYVPACYQYVNIAQVRIEGFEFESVYDAGDFFTGLNVTLLNGVDQSTGDVLETVPPAQITGRLGFRFFERRATLGGEVQHVFENEDVSAPFGEDYTLVNLFASYVASENVRVDLRINNLLDETYANYLNAITLPTPVYEPGFNAKLGATIRFGAS